MLPHLSQFGSTASSYRPTQIPSGLDDSAGKRKASEHPLLEPLSAACVLISFIAYNTTSVGPLGFLLFLGSGTIGLWGLWAVSLRLFFLDAHPRLTASPDSICWLFQHLPHNGSRQANVSFYFREQSRGVVAEEAMEGVSVAFLGFRLMLLRTL